MAHLFSAEKSGRAQYEEFVKLRFVERSVPLDEPIKLNKIYRPGNLPKLSKEEKALTDKDDLHLIGKLYIALETREGSSDTLFIHENRDQPPSISNEGKLRDGQKSDLVKCIQNDCNTRVIPVRSSASGTMQRS